MLDHEILKTVAEQMISGADCRCFGKDDSGNANGVGRLPTVRFQMGGGAYQAIEQNPEKPSAWGKLALEGHRAVQFRDLASGKYVSVVVDGKMREYGW